MEKIVLIGAAGHCKVIIDIINSMDLFDIIGITDNNKKKGENVCDVNVIGDDYMLCKLYNSGVKNAFICIGALNNMGIRNTIYNNLKKIGFNIPCIIHKSAIVSKHSTLGDGTCVMPGTVINADSIIGENCIINTSSIIEHECILKKNVHISPGACLCGNVKIGENTHVGAGSTVIQGITIGSNSIIGAGSVVINDVLNNSVVVGVPAKTLKRR